MVVPSTATRVMNTSLPLGSLGHTTACATASQSMRTDSTTATYANSVNVSHLSQRT